MRPNPALTPRPLPVWEGKTFRDLVNFSLELGEVIQSCEIDKKAARETCQ